jgi:hypothetical protein
MFATFTVSTGVLTNSERLFNRVFIEVVEHCIHAGTVEARV